MTDPQWQESEDNTDTGADDFFRVLKSYSKIVTWGFGAAVAPIVAGFAKLAPPWPPTIVQFTSLFEVIVLVLVFQLISGYKAAKINKIMITSFFVAIPIMFIYFAFISQFVYEEPLSGQRFVKGFACMPEAITVFPGRCPFYTDENLRSAEWEASRLWQPWSITAVRLSLIALWTSLFMSIATLLGSFLVYQSGLKARKPLAPPSS